MYIVAEVTEKDVFTEVFEVLAGIAGEPVFHYFLLGFHTIKLRNNDELNGVN